MILPILAPIPAVRRFALIPAILAVVLAGGMAAAQDSGIPENPAETTLIARDSALDQNGDILLGLRIDMQPGWRTYWKNPGDFGIPPVFDWSDSGNLKTAEILWPAPDRFGGPENIGFGYEAAAFIPVRARAVDPMRPLAVALTLDYAVCSDEVCIPLRTTIDKTIPPAPGTPGPHADDFRRALAMVPQQTAPGMSIARVSLEQTGAHAEEGGVLRVAVACPRPLAKPQLIVEGPADVRFGIPILLPARPGNETFLVPVSGNTGQLSGQTVTLTLKDQHGALANSYTIQ